MDPPPPPLRWMLCPPPVSIATTRPAVASTITSARTGTTHTGRFDCPSTNPVRFVVELPAHASFDKAWGPSAKLPRRVRVRSASRAARQPEPAAVMAWRYVWSTASPHANTPATDVRVDGSSTVM